MSALVQPKKPGDVASILAYVSSWVLFALLVSSQSAMVYAATGGSVAWRPILTINSITAVAMAIVGVVPMRAAHQLPLERGNWMRRLPTHFALLMGCWIAAQTIVSSLRSAVDLPSSATFGRQLLGSINLVVVVYVVLVLVVQARAYRRDLQERELRASQAESRLTTARLEALRAQLNPHFLFNTMHAIAALVREEPDAAEDMLAELSDLIRLTIDGSADEEVTLREEVDFIERYLRIQHSRFHDRLTIETEVSADCEEGMIPSLLLQPLVENAIEHGVGRSAAGGVVALRADRKGRSLRIVVENDGPPLATRDLDPSGWGLGLRNTSERLSVHFPGDHRFDLTPRDEGGVTVTVELPYRESRSDD